MLSKLVLCVLILISALISGGYTLEVAIPQGILSGDTRTNRDGGLYYSFKNIPYAKPPIGELRFKAPEPADGWEGVRDATNEVPQCVQISAPIQGQEDCLYLNVYTPEVQAEGVTPKPVMVYIYGGAFRAGDAREASFGAQFLMTKDVVVVTINYRVGLFGFITLDDPNLGVTGNAALKDQVLALQWVQDNIEYFGGDRNNVLIFGESAGAMSVHLHLLSPMSEGLFHKAIAESGVGISPLIFNNVRNTAVSIADQIGIPSENWSEMISSLQEASIEDLVNAEIALNVDHWLLSLPKIEIASNESSFLNRDAMEIIKSGDFHKVPFLHGFNEAEGTLLYMEIGFGSDVLVPDFTRFIPVELEIEPGSEAEEDIVQRLKDFYYDGGESTPETIKNDFNMYTDFAFGFPHYRASIEQSKTSPNPIYLYYYTAVAEFDYDFGLGAGHGAEVAYLWYTGTIPEEGSRADTLSRNLVDMWTNFAIYGNPTPEGFDYTWEPIQENQNNFLHIATEGSFPEVNVLQENLQFWSDIYEEYLPN